MVYYLAIKIKSWISEMNKKLGKIFLLLKNSVKRYQRDDPVKLSGNTAYFTVFAMAPIIIIIISVIGILMGKENIQEKVFSELGGLIGEQGTEYVESLISNYQNTRRNVAGTIIGFIVFIFTSTTFFTILQKSLNDIWRIRVKPSRNLLKSFYNRLISFGMILSLGFIMLVSLLIDAGLSILSQYLRELIPDLAVTLLRIGNFIITFGIIMVIFAMIYKFLPDAYIKWNVTWTGAFITTLLFIAGKELIGLFLGTSNIGLMYGAAGSLVIILLWVYYASMIFFFGAEITQQYAEMYGHRIIPKEYAVKVVIDEVETEIE